ncbi:MAG: ArsR family transcriptional regulator [Sulfobacillus acidophilus]|uniref:ArsR family transcriptional regulator n=1 Tax=Sulfobacillus acidophilus TaxID=53633 RepID=A0A2T2WEG4_9FIRM|nr:MAG: ArsR family transcriptional regulator [Sulfobacillus acidophilus]
MDFDRAFKDAIYEQIARAGRALAHPRRLELLDLLCQGPMTVESLARKSAMSIGNTSQHLQHLKDAHLVRAQVRGTTRLYRLNDAAACDLFRSLRSYAEQHYADMHAITQAFLHDREALEAIDAATLSRRLQEDAVILLDVRPPEEFAAGHWPGAISMPLEDLSSHSVNLPHDRTIVAYCRGPYCVLAVHAVEILRDQGFSAVRLTEGVADWRAQGLAVEVEDQTS